MSIIQIKRGYPLLSGAHQYYLHTPAENDVVDHFNSLQVEHSNNLKVKVESFRCHPCETGSVQVMKGHSHRDAYPLQQGKIIRIVLEITSWKLGAYDFCVA